MASKSRMTFVVPGDDPIQIQGFPELERLEPHREVALYEDRPSSPEEKLERAKDADVTINSRGAVTWHDESLRAIPKPKMIAACSIGTDMIDLETASELGIVVSNLPNRLS